MAKLPNPFLGLSVSGSISGALTYLKRMGHQIVENKPELKDPQTQLQLDWRHMFLKVVALWHALSAAEKAEWESAARPKHMTGYSWYISQALRPNPGIYLPLQGGTMQGIIQMDGYPIQTLKDPVAAQDGDTKAARDAAIAAAIGGSLHCDIYAWDGFFWDRVALEGFGIRNLKVKLFDGVNGIDSSASTTTLPLANRALHTVSLVTGFAGANAFAIAAHNAATDAKSVATFLLATGSYLYGYNGATWDRLRSYPTGILKVGRAEIDSTAIRKVGAGAVVGGARKLFWVSCSPDAPGAEFELTDAIAGAGAVIFDHFDPDKHSEIINFDPPLKFSTGIWIEKFDHIHSLVFCYI